MPPLDPVRLVFVDDHPLTREGVAALIGREPDLVLVGEGGTAAEAVELFRTHRPDVGVIDLGLPDGDGVAAARRILAEFPAARLILLSSFAGEEPVYQALQAGAKAFLFKDAARDELVAAVRAVAAGRTYLPAGPAARLARRVGGDELTGREVEVLGLVAEGLRNKEVAARLGLSEHTVKVHVQNILAKLRAGDRTEAVTAAVRRGIIRL